jgi:hypothetical protein
MDPHTIHSLQNERYLGALLRGSFIVIHHNYLSSADKSLARRRLCLSGGKWGRNSLSADGCRYGDSHSLEHFSAHSTVSDL